MASLRTLLTVVSLLLVLLSVTIGTSLATMPARPDDVIWSKEIGGPGDEYGYSVIALPDGGYAIAGKINDTGSERGLLVKIDGQGLPDWNQSYSSGELAAFYDIGRTADGGYVLCGETVSGDAGSASYNGLALKTDANGDQQWAKAYGGPGLELFTASIVESGGYLFTGINGSVTGQVMEAYLVKTDLNGNEVFTAGLGSAGLSAEGYDGKKTPDGGYIIAGSLHSEDAGTDRPYLVKVDSTGKEQWSRTLDTGAESYAESVITVSDGYVLAGTIENGMTYDLYLAKTDLDGNLLWNRSYGGLSDERAKCVIATPDGGYLLSALIGPEDGQDSTWVIKTDKDGYVVWDREFESEGRDVRLYRAVMSEDGGYVLAGYVSTADYGYDVWAVKLRGEPGYSTVTERPTPATSDGTLCCLPALVLPLLLVGTTFVVRRK